MATVVERRSSISEVVFEDLKTEQDFDDLKTEFCVMYQEIKEKNQELEALRKSLADAETRLAEKDDAAMKMVDQMEELHENLAELDARFERSEEVNKQLIEEKEEMKHELEKEVDELKKSLVTRESEAKGTREALSKLSEEFKKYQNESNNKMENLQNTYKSAIETVLNPLSSYLQKNKGSKIPLKKTKGYHLLKTTHTELQTALSATMNDN